MKNEEDKIDLRLESFGEAVRSAARKHHKLKAEQRELFKNAIRDQGKQDQGASNVLPFSKERSKKNQQDQSNQKLKDDSVSNEKDDGHSNQKSKDQGHSH